MQKTTTELIEKMLAGDKRALARLMTYVDNRHSDLLELMATIHKHAGRASRLGITGPPGAGKSSLVDKLIGRFRHEGKKVGVVAIDPSSPFSGGAVLGDRIRMQAHNADEGVFIRSLGSRGAHGGLSRATRDIVELLDAFGSDVVMVETVGVGQTELDIMSLAHTTLVVLVPESGDTIQTMKAGLMEIADIFVVNKADREGADKIYSELKSLSHMYSSAWPVPVIKTVATTGAGVAEILTAIGGHEKSLKERDETIKLSEDVLWQGCEDILFSEIDHRLRKRFASDRRFQEIYQKVTRQEVSAYEAVQALLKLIHL